MVHSTGTVPKLQSTGGILPPSAHKRYDLDMVQMRKLGVTVVLLFSLYTQPSTCYLIRRSSLLRQRSQPKDISPSKSFSEVRVLPFDIATSSGCSFIAASDQYGLLASITTSACLATYLEKHNKLFKALSAPVTAMLLTVIATNTGILPCNGSPFIGDLQKFVVKLATPLLLLSADVRRIVQETGPMLKAFILGSIGTLLGSFIGCTLLKGQLQTIGVPGDWKIVAALVGKNIGGGLNYMVVADVLDISDKTKALGLAVDNLLGLIYFPFISWLGTRYEAFHPDTSSPDNNFKAEEPVHVVVTKEVNVSDQKEWIAMANELSKNTWEEKGCISYTFCKKVNDHDLNKFNIVEKWASMADLEAHFQSEHFKRLVPAMDKISETISIDICDDVLSIRREDSDIVKSGDDSGNSLSADNMISAFTVACMITAVSEAMGNYLSLSPLPISSLLSIMSATLFSQTFSSLVPAGEALGKVLLMLFFGSIGNSMGLISTALSAKGILSLLSFGLILYTVHLSIIIGVGNSIFNVDMPDILLASNANIGNHATASSLAVSKGWSKRVLPAVLIGTLGNAIGSFCGIFFGSNVMR